MRQLLVAFCLLVASPRSADAQVSVGFGVDIGFHLPAFPELVVVPGYPVYYAPAASANYFFYDGVYWVFHEDNWYASSWYNGPWRLVRPHHVPLYVLRVPVRYYRVPPPYFRPWRPDRPPRWGQRWGAAWERSHEGWDHWDRRAVPRPAPLPVYQRDYHGDRYPRTWDDQHRLHRDGYRYRPRDRWARDHYRPPEPAPPPRGQPPPPRPYPEPRPVAGPPDRHEDRRDRREDRRDRREDVRDRREDHRDRREDVRDRREDHRDRREDRREERREERRDERRGDGHGDHGRGNGNGHEHGRR